MQEACPVRGNWARQWDPANSASWQHEAALAASQGHAASLIPAAASYYGLSLEDYVTKQNAICYLNREVDAWRSKQHPRGPFRADITDGASAHISASSRRFFQYNWACFVKGRKWYKVYFEGEQFRITRLELAWHGGLWGAVFLGTRADGQMFQVNPREENPVLELSWGTHGFWEIGRQT